VTPEQAARYDRAAALPRLLAADRIPGAVHANSGPAILLPGVVAPWHRPGDSSTFGVSPPRW
jgi:hypothetical protein